MLFLTYQETSRDPAEGTARIARFMGVDLTPQELESVLRQASFAAMKREVHKFKPPPRLPWSGNDFTVRRGASGKFSELLTPEQQRRIDDRFRAELKRLDCDFPYDEAYGAGGAEEERRAA